MASIFFTGGKEMARKLDAIAKEEKNKVLAGMIDAARLVRRDMEKSLPVTPVDWGNLRASFFISTYKGNTQTGKESFKGPKAARVAADTIAAKARALAEAKSAKNITLVMGYGANYAIWVHEMIGENVNWSKKGSGPKWFESALKRNRKDMMSLIGNKAKITSIKHYTRTSMFQARTEKENLSDITDPITP